MIVANPVPASAMRPEMASDSSLQHGTAPRDAVVPADARRTLARWMLGRWEPATDHALDEDALELLKALAWSEGVTVVIGDRLARCAGVPAALRQLCQDWTRGQAAAELGRRNQLHAILSCLDAAGIHTLVLKGAALAQWLYPAPYLRESADIDLLFTDRADALRAAAALEALDYSMPYRPGRFRHELGCRGNDDMPELDLHWALIGWPVLDRLPDFAVLHSNSIPLRGLGADARGLDTAHALLHACVHRASNLAAGLGDRLKWLYDLHLLAAVLDRDAEWPRFVAVCRQAQACGIAEEGLAAAAVLFGTVAPESVTRSFAEMRKSEPLDASRLSDWHYVQQCNFRALDGWGNRLAWLGDRLLPSSGHLRALYGEDQDYVQLLWRRLRRAASRLVGRG